MSFLSVSRLAPKLFVSKVRGIINFADINLRRCLVVNLS